MKLLVALALSLLATIAHADGSLSCPAGFTITCDGSVPPIPACPSPPGSGPCGPVVPACPSPPGSGPCPVVPPVVGACPLFNKTIFMTMNWANPQRLQTSMFGNMGFNDAVVVIMKTGGVSSPTNNLPRISGSEQGSSPSTRVAVLSDKPCDWGAQPMLGASSSGTTVTVPFTVANTVNYGYYPILELNKTYYFNIKNDTSPGCAFLSGDGACNMAIDLSKPGFEVDSASLAVALMGGTAAADQAFAKAGLAYAKAKAKVQDLATPSDVATERAKAKK